MNWLKRKLRYVWWWLTDKVMTPLQFIIYWAILVGVVIVILIVGEVLVK